MAEWKKVVVSGSAISQLNNDANYIAQDDTGVSLSGSFSGSFFGDGSGLSGVAASFPTTYVAPADAVKVFVNDGASKFTSASAFADYTLGKISGDATVAAGGALTIANTAVEGAMLNSNVADGTTITLSANTLSTLKVPNDLTIGNGLASSAAYNGSAARTVAVGAGTHITVNPNDVAVNTSTLTTAISGAILNTIAGDVNVSTGGVSTIQASAVEGTMLNSNVADGTTIEVSSNTLSTLKVPNALTAGTGLSSAGTFDGAAARTFAVSYGSTAGTAAQGNTTITLNQTAGEIDITGTAAQALGGAPSYTIGLADTITGARTFSGDITFSSDIVVQGTASFQNTTNLEVADKFILLNSGSATDNSPGGIVVQQNTQDEGVAFAYDAAAGSNSGRWGTKDGQDASTSTFTANAYVSYVVDVDAGQSDIALYQQNGNIKVDSGDIWIYS